MTTKTRPCALCRRRPRLYFVTSQDLCQECYDYAGWENEHSDEAHESLSADDPTEASYLENCPICQGVPAPWTTEEEPVKTRTAPKSRRNPTTSHMSHASCAHPRTPAGRASCRKAIRAAFAPEPTYPTSTVGKGKAIHLVLVSSEGIVSPICSGGKKTIVTDPIQRLIKDVTCKTCLRLHK